MKRIIQSVLFVASLLYGVGLYAQTSNLIKIGSKKVGVECEITPHGSIHSLHFFHHKGEVKNIPFQSDEWKGFSFVNCPNLTASPKDASEFTAENNEIKYQLNYSTAKNCLKVKATLTNGSDKTYAPDRESLNFGIDTWLNKFPEWNSKYLPTLFRCEVGGMWGYMVSPVGDILVVTSPTSVGSYTLNYQQAMYGHYIHTVTFDLLCQEPLPSHHPRLLSLKPSESMSWEFTIEMTPSIDQVEAIVAQRTHLPLINLERYSLEPQQTTKFTLFHDADVEITKPSGIKQQFSNCKAGAEYVFDQNDVYGLYQMSAVTKEGRRSTASYYVHPKWSWYMSQSRLESLNFVPRTDTGNDCCETWYNVLAFYLAEKYSPDQSLLKAGEEITQQILDTLFVEKNGFMFTKVYPERIQNVSAMVSIMADKYHVSQNREDMELAVKMVDYILSRQHETGYYGGYGMKHYTSVMYVAKSILELMDEMEPLAKTSQKWREIYQRYDHSVMRAMDELALRGNNISTEGDNTFEDGAVSCSALQLLNYALRQSDPAKREKYKASGLHYLNSHTCLTRLLDTDCRSRGGTARFWESWGDIHTPIQVMLSPHGWSGWRLYASYYAYLLTGEENNLNRVMDAMGACTQLMEFPSGKMRNSFTPDPRIMAGVLKPDATNPHGKFYPGYMGQCYMDNIGTWYGCNSPESGYLNKSLWDWCGDGTSFEIIKAMEEIVVPNCFVLERKDGSLLTYNCRAQLEDGQLVVIPSESIVSNLHYNLKQDKTVVVHFSGATVSDHCQTMGWIRR